MKPENHFLRRGGWRKASVSGGNDGILSVTSLPIEAAEQRTGRNALEVHARDELRMNEINQAKILQAGFASVLSFMQAECIGEIRKYCKRWLWKPSIR